MLQVPARGTIVAGRFVVDDVVGRGGMGVVLRARDEHDGGVVALKLLHTGDSKDQERFAREGRVLSELRHPAIVRFIAHGIDATGTPYLAMEWLEGEHLGAYLKRARPTVEEALALTRRLADALGTAHRRHVVHRDLKPSNVFLVGGDLGNAKLLDFGVAKAHGDDELRTATGLVIGTPGYMSPEQARGEREVDARSDVFSLGVLLYRCLAGRRPFEGRDALALLMRVLLQDPPPLRDVRPDIPHAVEALVATMLSKAPERRPVDASAVVAALDALGEVTGPPPASTPDATPAITTSEQRMLCVVLIGTSSGAIDDDAPTVIARAPTRDRLLRIATSFGGVVHGLVDGSVLVTFGAGETLSELSVRAARCALAIRDEANGPRIAIVTGHGELAERLRVGDLLDRGAALLAASAPGVVRIDDVTARWLETRFELDAAGTAIVAERPTAGVRTLLGKSTPLVGRDREIAHLESYLEECISEPVARAVLLTGAAGFGKSRLRYELLRRIGRRSEPVTVWLSQGDPMSAGAPYAMIAPLIRRALGILDGEPLEARREKLRAGVADPRVREFLGELVSTPFEDESVQLRAARREPVLLGDQIRRAFEDFVSASCAERPLLIVLEDLHWGDRPSVRLIDSMLRLHRDRPVMVLALARAEVHTLFPGLWAERGLQEIKLGSLTRKASERLVRQTLGAVDDAVVEEILERAEGNAFYLEELIRAAAEGPHGALPGTVLGMVQARLEALEPESRRVLRAGAVFGHAFHRGGVAALLGGDVDLDHWLTTLVEREVLSERTPSRFPGERELAFRHALVRDAAYAMLTDGDRALGHQLAADWLDAKGETEAIVLAAHCERAGMTTRALRFYRRAAEQALEANDFAATIERAERGLSKGASGEDRGALLTLQAEAHRWRGEMELAEARGAEALSLLPVGSRRWCQTAAEVALVSGRRGNSERMLATSRALYDAVVAAPADAAKFIATIRTAVQLFHGGHYDLAIAIAGHVERFAHIGDDDPAFAARLEQMRVARATFTGDLAERRRRTALAVECFHLAGDLRNTCTQQVNVGYSDLSLGAFSRAIDALTDALQSAERMGLSHVATVAKHNLGMVLARVGRLDEALRYESDAVIQVTAQGDRRIEGAARTYLAAIHLLRGSLDEAEREARLAVAVSEQHSPTYAHALAGLTEVLLKRGGANDEALTHARRAREILEQLGSLDDGESLVLVTYAEALAACGDREGSRRAILDARARIEAIAARIADEELRATFLHAVPENARILELSSRC